MKKNTVVDEHIEAGKVVTEYTNGNRSYVKYSCGCTRIVYPRKAPQFDRCQYHEGMEDGYELAVSLASYERSVR
jgi:hypothetical protein